jgi:hypothetical protein
MPLPAEHQFDIMLAKPTEKQAPPFQYMHRCTSLSGYNPAALIQNVEDQGHALTASAAATSASQVFAMPKISSPEINTDQASPYSHCSFPCPLLTPAGHTYTCADKLQRRSHSDRDSSLPVVLSSHQWHEKVPGKHLQEVAL